MSTGSGRAWFVAGCALAVTGSAFGQAGSGPGRAEPVPGNAPAGPTKSPGQPRTSETAAARVDLRPRFEPGQIVRYVWVLRSEQALPTGEGEAIKSTLMQEIGLKMVTRGVDAGSGEATVELVYERVKASIDSALGKIEFDSTAKRPAGPGKGGGPAEPDPLDALDPEKLIADHFAGMVGTTLEMKVGRDGRIASVKGGGSLVPKGLGIGGMDPSAALGGLFGPISTRSSTGFDGTARVGDRWTHTSTTSVGPLGGLDLQTNYELRSHSGGVAQVYFSGRAETASPGQSPAGAPQGAVDTRQNGSYRWDTRLGQLAGAQFEQSASIALPGPGNGQGSGGRPMTATTRVTIERVR